MLLSLVLVSAAISVGYRRPRRMKRPVATIAPHQGRPPIMWKCSTLHSIMDEKPQPKSKPNCFKYPICSGIALISAAVSSLRLTSPWGARETSLAAGTEGVVDEGAEEVELKRAAATPVIAVAGRQERVPSSVCLDWPYGTAVLRVCGRNEDICRAKSTISYSSRQEMTAAEDKPIGWNVRRHTTVAGPRRARRRVH